MRYLLIAALILAIGKPAEAQWKSFTIGPKGDTLNRVDQKGLKQGPWVIHVDELRGERGYEEEGYFVNDRKEDVWKRFSLEGDLIALESYRYGMKHGKCMYFTNAGEPLREESWRAIDPNNPYDTVDVRDVNDPSKITGHVVVKLEPNSYKNGTWIYYNTMNGTVEKTEEWQMDKPKQKEEAVVTTAATEEGDLTPIDVANGTKGTPKKVEPKPSNKPQAILDYEKKNSGKKKIKVRDGSTG